MSWRRCAVDQEPRKFDEERAAILCNLAELVVRELEAAWAAQYQRRQAAPPCTPVEKHTVEILLTSFSV